MKYLTIALSLAAAVIAQSPIAMAQDASAKAREMFIKADTNQDGSASRDHHTNRPIHKQEPVHI